MTDPVTDCLSSMHGEKHGERETGNRFGRYGVTYRSAWRHVPQHVSLPNALPAATPCCLAQPAGQLCTPPPPTGLTYSTTAAPLHSHSGALVELRLPPLLLCLLQELVARTDGPTVLTFQQAFPVQ